jgi:hypothetical protein
VETFGERDRNRPVLAPHRIKVGTSSAGILALLSGVLARLRMPNVSRVPSARIRS